MKHLIALGAVAFALALASNTYAADGVVLINQSTSITGLPGCGSSGFPIVICQPGSYRLSGNLTVTDPTKDAIDINASNVTLDLNGFSVSGSAVCTGSGNAIVCTGSETGVGIKSANTAVAISLTNGSVSGFIEGVTIQGRVDSIRSTSNKLAGISVRQGSIVRGSFVSLNGAAGIVGDLSIISGNIALNNFGDGFAGDQSTFTNNMSSENGASGISTSCPSNLIGNTAPFNTFGSIHTAFTGCALANNVP
ncbi:MAG TPA: hypothetical protein VMH80_21080 [Bryobacteraceae bacterium]|nr:hypothetical protein [Bryobacteraceae bacterium]